MSRAIQAHDAGIPFDGDVRLDDACFVSPPCLPRVSVSPGLPAWIHSSAVGSSVVRLTGCSSPSCRHSLFSFLGGWHDGMTLSLQAFIVHGIESRRSSCPFTSSMTLLQVSPKVNHHSTCNCSADMCLAAACRGLLTPPPRLRRLLK